MNKRQQFLTLVLVLLITLSGVSCSDDETEAAAEPTGRAQESIPAPSSATEEDELTATVDEEEYFEEEELGQSVDLASAYHEECDGGKDTSLDCEVLRSLLVVEVAMALEDIERSRDQRGTEEAMAALDLVDEPEILIAACRVLGYFPDTPGIAEKAMPLLLDSPYLAVEQVAARLLSQNPHPAAAGMGSQWSTNHGLIWTDNPYAPAPDFPEHYFDIGFPDYPDAEWYSPADSDRSIGWWVTGSPAEVSAWFAAELSVEAIGYYQWVERSGQKIMAAYQAAMDQPSAVKLQQLTEKYMATQDPALVEQLQKLQDENQVRMQKIEADEKKSVMEVAQPPGGVAPEEVYYLIAKEKAGHVSRLIMVYRHAGSERTVMQMTWDLRDYPAAWPIR